MTHRGHLREIDPETLYELLRLRVDVFVVEQNCPYAELDGRDREVTAEHLWRVDEADDGRVIATLRVLTDADGSIRIGRVATRASHRGRGLAAGLISAAIEGRPGPFVLDAQTHLADWYGRQGFVVDGPEFVEDGIPHVPMRRATPG